MNKQIYNFSGKYGLSVQKAKDPSLVAGCKNNYCTFKKNPKFTVSIIYENVT
jgi:hypothetical protein